MTIETFDDISLVDVGGRSLIDALKSNLAELDEDNLTFDIAVDDFQRTVAAGSIDWDLSKATIHASGTTNGSANWADLSVSTDPNTKMPSWMHTSGNEFYAKGSQSQSGQVTHFCVFFMKDLNTLLKTYYLTDELVKITVPDNTTITLIRFLIRSNTTGVSFDVHDTLEIYRDIPFKYQKETLYPLVSADAAGIDSIDDIDFNSVIFVERVNNVMVPSGAPFLGHIVTSVIPPANHEYVTGLNANSRLQIAFPYADDGNANDMDRKTTLPPLYRTYRNSAWTAWKSLDGKIAFDSSSAENLCLGYCNNSCLRGVASSAGVTLSIDETRGCFVLNGTATGNGFINIIDQTCSIPRELLQAGKQVFFGADTSRGEYKTNKYEFKLYAMKQNMSQAGLLFNRRQDIRRVVLPADTYFVIFRVDFSSGTVFSNEPIYPYFGVTLPLGMHHEAIMMNRGTIEASDRYQSVDDIDENGILFVSVTGGVPDIPDVPVAPCWLWTTGISDYIGYSSAHRMQLCFPWSMDNLSNNVLVRTCKFSTWNAWRELGESTVTEVTVEKGIYNNTYNITSSPSITTDDHNWLEPVDTDTADETGKTDMAPAIMSMLNSTGYCKLAPGIFYVDGGIDMPTNATLEGCGKSTIVRLLQNSTNGYCVRVCQNNTVRDMQFQGSRSNVDVSTESIADRNGVIYIGNADGNEQSQPTTSPCLVDGCFFKNFTGSGIYCHNTGGGVWDSALTVNDCMVNNCEVGINVDYFSEYSKFNNVIIHHCHYACINNGGNNVFSGCTFHGTVGFLIDNTNSKSPNNAHGSAIGCTFNHIDNWNHPDVLGMGVAVKAINQVTGFMFTGCQFWYGGFDIDNSMGVNFVGCLIGGNTPSIKVTGSYPVYFQDCMFHQVPSINAGTGKCVVNSCYHESTGNAISGT